jgi:hypothetical protein
MDIALQRLRLGRDGRSAMLTGLRGVGKTVLLNEFEQLAQGRGYFHEHVEINEDGDLPVRLVSAFRRVLLAMDARRRIGERVRRALGVLKALSLRLPNGPELSIDVVAVSGPADSGDLPPTWPASSSSWARSLATTTPGSSSPSTSSTT